MTTEAFRAAVVTKLQAWATGFPSLRVVYENGPVPDEGSIGNIWLDQQLRWYGGAPVSIGSDTTRHSGAISLMVFYRSAAGTAEPGAIVDSLLQAFRRQRLGGAVLRNPQRTVPTNLKGWYKTGILVPFTLDD